MPSSTGTLVFNDQKIQAPDIYATESLGVGVSDPTSNLEVVGNAYVSSNLEVGTANLFVDTTTGNVGIGTTNPLSPLHIRGDNCRLLIADSSENDADTNAFKCGIAFVDNTYDGTTTYAGNPAAGMGFFIGHASSSNKEVNIRNLTGELSFGTRNISKAMYINNSGNVGIGTTSPAAKLHVQGDLYVSSPKIENLYYNPNNWGYSSTNTTAPGTSLWSFTYNAPADGYIIATTNGHWQHSGNGYWIYSWISIDGKTHRDSSLYDTTTVNFADDNSGNFHEYRHNDQSWHDYNFSTCAYVSQGSRTIGLHVRTNYGTLYINGAAIRLLFIPKNYM